MHQLKGDCYTIVEEDLQLFSTSKFHLRQFVEELVGVFTLFVITVFIVFIMRNTARV